MNFDPTDVIRVGTDLRFVDKSKPWDKVSWQLERQHNKQLIVCSAGTKISNLTMVFEDEVVAEIAPISDVA